MSNAHGSSHNPHIKHFFVDTLKFWVVSSIALIIGVILFNNFSHSSRASSDEGVKGLKTTKYSADRNDTMNENGTSYSKPDDNRAPSWIGTDTNVQASYLDLRFEDGSIPLNTNIVSANLEIYSAADQTNPVTVLIGVENVRSPEEFDTEDPPSTRSLMTKKIAVAITEP